MLVRWLSCFVFVIAALSFPLASRAQDAPSNPRDEARAAFRAGTAAFDGADYAAALDHYRRAFGLSPHDAVRFNIAVCLERLGRFREAAEQYRRASESREVDASARTRALEQMSEMSSRLGTVVIAGTPEGAAVTLDGEALCVLPCREQVDPGEHTVRGRAADGAETTERINVARGETLSVRLEMTRRPVAELPLIPTPTAPRNRTPTPTPTTSGPGALAFLGLAVTVLGSAGAVVAGLRTNDLHNDYLALPTAELRDEGLLMQGLFHASLGLAAVGGLMALIDALSTDTEERPPPAGASIPRATRF